MERERAAGARGIDIVVFLGGLLVIGETLAMMRVQGTFAALMSDLGGHVPPLTRALLLPWVPPTIGASVVGIAWEGMIRKRGETAMAVRAALVLLFAVGSPILFLVAIYQPLWRLGDSIK